MNLTITTDCVTKYLGNLYVYLYYVICGRPLIPAPQQTTPFFNHFIVRFHCLVSKLLSMTKAEPYSCLLLLSEYRWITISPYRITTVGSCVLELVWKVTQVRNQSGHRWNSKYNANTKDKYKYEMLLKFWTKQGTNKIPNKYNVIKKKST